MIAGCGSSAGLAPSTVPSTVSNAAPAPAASPVPAAPPATASVSITPFGLIPYEATVAVGGRVTFVNNDNIPHDIQGGPDPEHRDCSEIDTSAFSLPAKAARRARSRRSGRASTTITPVTSTTVSAAALSFVKCVCAFPTTIGNSDSVHALRPARPTSDSICRAEEMTLVVRIGELGVIARAASCHSRTVCSERFEGVGGTHVALNLAAPVGRGQIHFVKLADDVLHECEVREMGSAQMTDRSHV
jgi:plastocyanin